MKLIILKSNLKNGLDGVGRAISPAANLPVLGSILIKAEGNQIKISATNLELAITRVVSGKIIEEGEVVVPHSTIASIINNISTERVNLETKKGALVLKTDNYEASIQGVDPKEFPIIPSIKEKKESLEIDSSTLSDALQKVVIAAEASDLRPEISGVLFSIDGQSLKIVATDSFRLAEATIPGGQLKSTLKDGLQITVPIKAAQEIARGANEKESFNIYTDETQVLFESESLELISRLVEGKYPDYETIIPKDIETKVSVDREELIGSLKLAGSFAGRSSEVTLRAKDKKVLEVYSSDSSIGENQYLIPAKIDGPDMEVIFNWQFLLDGIKGESRKEITLGLNGEEKPTIIKSTEGASHFYILMPIRA